MTGNLPVNPSEILQAGCEILDAVLVPHGFARMPIEAGKGSGGHFAMTEYVRGERRLEVHYRFSLGLVAYHVGDSHVSHQSYMRQVLGPGGGNQYPGFSQDPLDGFRHLAHDLGHFGSDFLQGSAADLRRAAQAAAAAYAAESLHSMADAAGDLQKRSEARKLFRRARYAAAVERLRSLRYPEQMTPAERKLFSLAQRYAAKERPPERLRKPWWKLW